MSKTVEDRICIKVEIVFLSNNSITDESITGYLCYLRFSMILYSERIFGKPL